MKIEILYPEICCLFGDKANMRYFRLCLPEAEYFETPVSEEPRFLTEDMDMVYIGSCSESNQERIISRLKGHEERINQLVDGGTVFLMTGNAYEIMGNYIQQPDGSKIDCLGIVDFYAERIMPKRYNSLFLGTFGDSEIVGYTSRFSHTYGVKPENALFGVTKGCGSNKGCKTEGVKKNNFFGTYLLGPFLVQNPKFVEYILKRLGVSEPKLAFAGDILKAYEVRLEEFKKDIIFED